ncbi:hypothetical protein LUZ63_013467 [Rhynchospora breviuscula]|uniref:Protein FAM32A-like n=1 Tax=Rhynchospora breviuscula TaxID=2022672 RepID=A0A9Q0C8L8_9POAL|nr:hypothetical protein LUZ63_013467 [Rhynchospora breviuscula]
MLLIGGAACKVIIERNVFLSKYSRGKAEVEGKALDVKFGGAKKKKKLKHHSGEEEEEEPVGDEELVEGGSSGLATEPTEGYLTDLERQEREGDEGQRPIDDYLTPAERRYIEQKERIESHRLAKTADKSHRDRISQFNQYLANLSEHYDIPKVGPG